MASVPAPPSASSSRVYTWTHHGPHILPYDSDLMANPRCVYVVRYTSYLRMVRNTKEKQKSPFYIGDLYILI